MLCSKSKLISFTKSTLKNTVQYRYIISSHSILKRCVYRGWLATLAKSAKSEERMSPMRLLRDIRVNRLWSAWTRSYIVNNVVKRCRRDRTVREVIQCFRQALFRPRRTLLLSATAAYKRDDDEKVAGCENNITDEDLEGLLTELDGVEELSRRTLFCAGCGRRLVIDKKHPGVNYCLCKDAHIPPDSPDGWVPYMEAEDVIIWRKEYKIGQGLYAYKVYGRYKEVCAQDFAAVQVDGAYRRVWDAAVASLSVVERSANGVRDQAVLHWEVLWPRLFANRDYVYIRRHKEFEVRTECGPHARGLFADSGPCEPEPRPRYDETGSVHSNAKRKATQAYRLAAEPGHVENKVYIIVSRSCEHPKVPETKHAIRVSEYWSHMIVKTIDGADKCGMEFVLTYYDEPAVGGLPSGVAAWATGRAAPAYLQRMRSAAAGYGGWAGARTHQELPEFTPFVAEKLSQEENVTVETRVSEEEMETSKQGPELNSNHKETEAKTKDQSTQTDTEVCREVKVEEAEDAKVTEDKNVGTNELTSCAVKESTATSEVEANKSAEEEENNGGWWRYLYPFYYFI